MSRFASYVCLIWAGVVSLGGCTAVQRDVSSKQDKKYNEERKQAWREATGFNDPNFDRITKGEKPVKY